MKALILGKSANNLKNNLKNNNPVLFQRHGASERIKIRRLLLICGVFDFWKTKTFSWNWIRSNPERATYNLKKESGEESKNLEKEWQQQKS